jgi:hypothetical protein
MPANKGDKYNYSIIFKEALGFLDGSHDMEPMTLNKPVCEIDSILDLPFDNIKLAKKKLDVWTVFS